MRSTFAVLVLAERTGDPAVSPECWEQLELCHGRARMCQISNRCQVLIAQKGPCGTILTVSTQKKAPWYSMGPPRKVSLGLQPILVKIATYKTDTNGAVVPKFFSSGYVKATWTQSCGLTEQVIERNVAWELFLYAKDGNFWTSDTFFFGGGPFMFPKRYCVSWKLEVKFPYNKNVLKAVSM